MVDPRKRLKTVGLDADKKERQCYNSADHMETNDPETERNDKETNAPPAMTKRPRLWAPSSEAAVSTSEKVAFGESSREPERSSMLGFSGLSSSEPLSEFTNESSSGTPEQFKTAPVTVIPAKLPVDRPSETTASATGLPVRDVPGIVETKLRDIPGIIETNKDDEKWNRMFSKLQAYKTQLTTGSPDMDSTLAEWIHNQRIQYWLFHHQGFGQISQARIERLNRVDFDWDLHQQRSNRRLSGEATPTSSSRSSSGAKSGKRNAKGCAKEPREKKTRAQGPCASSSAESNSTPRSEHSSSSGDKAADSNSSTGRSESEELKTVKAPTLPDVVDAVEGVARLPPDYLPGIMENNKHDAKWNVNFNILQNYKRDFGDCNVPQVSDYDEKLGRWVHYQRVEYWLFQHQGHGKISRERIDALHSVGFDWDPQQTQWVNMYERLQAFKETNGHTVVGKSNSSDPELANWVRNQRLEHSYRVRGKKSRMTDERKLLMDALGFQWVLTMK